MIISENRYNLIVKHEGCGKVIPDSFKALLDKGTIKERDISSAFSYGHDDWVAENFSLPIGTHSLSASANVDAGGRQVGDVIDYVD